MELDKRSQLYECLFNCPYEGRCSICPTSKQGRWIKMSDADGSYYACSKCGESLERKQDYNPQFDLFPRLKSIDKTPYCPHCGAKMTLD